MSVIYFHATIKMSPVTKRKLVEAFKVALKPKSDAIEPYRSWHILNEVQQSVAKHLAKNLGQSSEIDINLFIQKELKLALKENRASNKSTNFNYFSLMRGELISRNASSENSIIDSVQHLLERDDLLIADEYSELPQRWESRSKYESNRNRSAAGIAISPSQVDETTNDKLQAHFAEANSKLVARVNKLLTASQRSANVAKCLVNVMKESEVCKINADEPFKTWHPVTHVRYALREKLRDNPLSGKLSRELVLSDLRRSFSGQAAIFDYYDLAYGENLAGIVKGNATIGNDLLPSLSRSRTLLCSWRPAVSQPSTNMEVTQFQISCT